MLIQTLKKNFLVDFLFFKFYKTIQKLIKYYCILFVKIHVTKLTESQKHTNVLELIQVKEQWLVNI